MTAAAALGKEVGKKAQRQVLKTPRATRHRHLCRPPVVPGKLKEPGAPLALISLERQAVADLLLSERLQGKAPHQAYAMLLDKGKYP
jgi:putative transposase